MRYYQNRSFSAVSLTVVEENGDIVYIGFGDDVGRATKRETPVIAEAFSQLSAYFDGRLKTFSLPLKLSGTPFQLKTWEALKTIPYGETRSYRDIARQIGNAQACRAVGMANHRNPVSLVIPCHRVIGANGSLTGYGGGLPIKEWLLALESHYVHERHDSSR